MGCRSAAQQGELIRLQVEPDGSVVVASEGPRTGRGAYLHAEARCIKLAVARRSIPRALRRRLSDVENANLARKLDTVVREKP